MPVNKCTDILRDMRDRQDPRYLLQDVLQAALEWIAENPISPTDEKMFARNLQRILFDTPQYPEEIAKMLVRRPWDRDVIIEAYNVGLKEREKP